MGHTIYVTPIGFTCSCGEARVASVTTKPSKDAYDHRDHGHPDGSSVLIQYPTIKTQVQQGW